MQVAQRARCRPAAGVNLERRQPRFQLTGRLLGLAFSRSLGAHRLFLASGLLLPVRAALPVRAHRQLEYLPLGTDHVQRDVCTVQVGPLDPVPAGDVHGTTQDRQKIGPGGRSRTSMKRARKRTANRLPTASFSDYDLRMARVRHGIRWQEAQIAHLL